MQYKEIHISPWVYVVSFLLALNMYTFPFCTTPWLVSEGPSWLGLDVSWQMVLNYANIQNWTWGKDIIYTYGPLGFLSKRLGWGVSPWVFLIFDAFLIVNFFYIFKDFLKAANNKLLAFFVLLGIILTLNPYHGTDLSWVLYCFSAYWGFKAYVNPTWRSIFMMCLVSIITFYVKMNTGLIILLICCGNIGILFITGKATLKKSLAILLMLAGGVFVTALLLNVSLPGYIVGSIEIVKGYKEVMALNHNKLDLEHNLFYIFRIVVYLLIVYAVYLVLKGKIVQIYYLGVVFVYIYLLRTQSYHRGDIQHLVKMCSYAPLILIFGNLIYHRDSMQKLFLGAICFITAVSLFYKVEYVQGINEIYKSRFLTKKDYVRQINESRGKQYSYQKDKRYIPGHIIQQIGNSTIDIFPWDCAYLLEHEMNYQPRPVFQSFSAYTPYLQKINYESYVKNAPKYLIYDYESIDGRYPFSDETLLNTFIVKNYRAVDSFFSNGRTRMVMKRHNTSPLSIDLLREEKININSTVEKTGDANFVRIYLDYNTRGFKSSFFNRPPQVKLKFTTTGGEEMLYKTSTELLKAGVMIDKLITSNSEYINIATASDIRYVQLVIEEQKYFEPDMTVKYYNVK